MVLMGKVSLMWHPTEILVLCIIELVEEWSCQPIGDDYSVYAFINMFVCFTGSTAKGDLQRAPLPPRPLVTHRPHFSPCSLSPHTFVMHPASGPYPPLSSCPVHAVCPNQVAGLSLPCLPVVRIYLNPTYMNPSTLQTPHILVDLLLLTQFHHQYTSKISFLLYPPCLPAPASLTYIGGSLSIYRLV